MIVEDFINICCVVYDFIENVILVWLIIVYIVIFIFFFERKDDFEVRVDIIVDVVLLYFIWYVFWNKLGIEISLWYLYDLIFFLKLI